MEDTISVPTPCCPTPLLLLSGRTQPSPSEPSALSRRAVGARGTPSPFPSPLRRGFDKRATWPSASTCTVVVRGATLADRLIGAPTLREWAFSAPSAGATTEVVPRLPPFLPIGFEYAVDVTSEDPGTPVGELRCASPCWAPASSSILKPFRPRATRRASAACAAPSSPSCSSEGSVA